MPSKMQLDHESATAFLPLTCGVAVRAEAEEGQLEIVRELSLQRLGHLVTDL